VPRLWAAVPIRSTTPTPTLQIPTRVGFNASAFAAPPATQTTETNERPGAIRGPGFWRTDLSLFKNMKFTERFTGQLRFDTFNTFNHTNPICCFSTSLISSFYNKVTSTRDPRILQLGMKVNF